ncbi:MAG: hypothetical protein QOJ98_2798 [Acidobacteriota bacterium]|nr:hypothetical protein [Acidobacteriota bacterium]
MARIVTVVVSLCFAGFLSAQTLERGKEHYRAGRYVDAIEDLRAAAAAALTPEARQAYVATGKLDTLVELEESLVYLALAYDRIGREAEARDAVTRLLNAERIKPTYASLPLTNDSAGFEALAERLVPSIPLTPNEKLKSSPGGIVVQPTLAQQRAEMMNLIEERVAAARAEIEKSANLRVAAAQREANERVEAERAAALKRADERVAAETAAAQRAAEERIAAERVAAEKSVEGRIAAGRAAATREAEARIAAERAAAEKRAEERIAAARAEAMKGVDVRIEEARAAAEKRAQEQIAIERSKTESETAVKIAAVRAEADKAAEAKISVEREAIQRLSEERIAIERAAAEKNAQERVAAVEAERRRALLASLREAETLAIAGQLPEANRIYAALAQSPTSTREAIAAAATGLYRTGAFQEAVRAFTRLGKLAGGEDDLRYYYAVSLYEIGKYAEAKQELSAALPNLQRTDDVERYRVKIEQSAAQQAAKK